jgi:ribonucleoside-diphosphate reductase alpha chain
VFVTAHDIEPYWHMRMQSAFQRHCDSSISKTINFPHDAKVDDVREIFDLAIDLDVKGVTVYRDGCRDMQPMALKSSGSAAAATPASDDDEEDPAAAVVNEQLLTRPSDSGPQLAPIKLPEIMSCLRIRQMTPFGNMHVKVTVDPISGREREVFAQLGKGGDVANSDLEAICRILSLWLRANGSLELAIKQLSGIGSSLTVPTKDGRIMSLADGLATALRRYLTAKKDHGLEALLLGRVQATAVQDLGTAKKLDIGARPRNVSQYKLKCPSCASALAFQEGCVKCHSCGFSQC